MKIRFIAICLVSLFLIISITPTTLNKLTKSYALQQVAGPIIVETIPGGETKTFSWGVLNEGNMSSTVDITADGIGAEFLSFPENVTLNAGGQTTHVPVNVTIPANYTGDRELTPSITATEAGEEVGPTIINIAVSKPLCIVVSQNNATTMTTPTAVANQQQNLTDLQLKDYTQDLIVHDNATGGNQSITIPIESTSNITEFSFNQTRNEISFKASGEAGTNGTTTLYVSQILQEPYSLVVDRIPSNNFDIITNSTTGEKGIEVTYRHHCMDNDLVLIGSNSSNNN